MKESERASNCIGCEVCKTRCPQKIDIPARLKETAAVFAASEK